MNTSQSHTTFKLSPFRYFFFWWLLFVIGYQVIGLLLYLGIQNSPAQTDFQQQLVYVQNNWWYSSIIYAIFLGIGTFVRTLLWNKIYKIEITDKTFEGRGSTDIVEPLSMVDRKRTMQKHFFGKLFRYRSIWFTDGKKFELHEYALPADEVTTILKKLGCE